MILKTFRITHSGKWIFLFLLLLSFSLTGRLAAQKEGQVMDRSTILQKISGLQDGVLIVRLESDRRKIEALEQLVSAPDISMKERRRLEVTLMEAREEAALNTTGYVDAFRDFYDFSDVVFMYDYQTRGYLEGQITFFDTTLNEVPGDGILARSHLVLSQGISENNGARMLEFLDEKLRPLGKPAPRSHFGVLSFVTTTGLRILRINRKLHKLAG